MYNAIDLSNENEVNELIIKIQERTIIKLKANNNELQQIIDKAIEYIERNRVHFDDMTKNRIPNTCTSTLLSILEGKETEQV